MAREANPIEVPDFNGDWAKYHEWYDEIIAKYQTNKDPNAADLTGSLLQFPRGDGYAIYIVTKHKPLTLACLLIGDAWEIDVAHIRGLRESDVRDQLERAARMRELFGKKK